MKRAIVLAAALAALVSTGCHREAVVKEPVAIRYDTSGCFGTCSIYTVTAWRDGRVIFEGRGYTAANGERVRHISGEEFLRLAAILAPLKPARGSIPPDGKMRSCFMTDAPVSYISWIGTNGSDQQRCLAKYESLAEAENGRARVRAALAMLPIQDLRRHVDR